MEEELSEVSPQLEGDCDKEGFLWKSGGKKRKTAGHWQRRWFVLGSGLLCYYKDTLTSQKKGEIKAFAIQKVEQRPEHDIKKKYGFVIVTEKRTFFLHAASSEERQEWIDAIQSTVTCGHLLSEEEALHRVQARQAIPQDSTILSIPVPTFHPSNVILSGYLCQTEWEKRKKESHWQCHFILLTKKFLLLFEKQGAQTPLGVIPMSALVQSWVYDDPTLKKKCCFIIKTFERIYLFSATTAAERQLWMNALAQIQI